MKRGGERKAGSVQGRGTGRNRSEKEKRKDRRG